MSKKAAAKQLRSIASDLALIGLPGFAWAIRDVAKELTK